jgi:CBS domain-containing protein
MMILEAREPDATGPGNGLAAPPVRDGSSRPAMTVDHVMTREVITVSPEMSLQAAARLLVEHGVAGFPVVDAHTRVIGVLCDEDLLARRLPRPRVPWWQPFYDSDQLARAYRRAVGSTVGDVMRQPAITAPSSLAVDALVHLLASEHVGVIAVVNDGRLVGVVHRRDLVLALTAAPSPSGPCPDAQLAHEMETRMARELWVSTPGARVDVNDGVLELRGCVASDAERDALEAMAAALPGCRGVLNRLVTRDGLGGEGGPRPWRNQRRA